MSIIQRILRKLSLKGRNLNLNSNSYTQKTVGIDVGFGSSNFGICITELIDGLVNVVHAEEYHRPSFDEMISITTKLLDDYNIKFNNSCRIFIDGSAPSFIRALKDRVDEDPEYEKQIVFYKHNYPSVYDLEFLQQNMFVIPVPFNKEHKRMLTHTKELLEYRNGLVAIHPKFQKLIISLRTAVENGEGILDKEATSHDDLYDAWRLSCVFWHS